MDANLLRGVKRRRSYCEHCETDVSKSTFYRHKSRFFDVSTGTWIKASEAHIDSYSSSSSDSEEDRSFHGDCFGEPEVILASTDVDNPSINVQQLSDSPSAVTHGDESSSSNQGNGFYGHVSIRHARDMQLLRWGSFPNIIVHVIILLYHSALPVLILTRLVLN